MRAGLLMIIAAVLNIKDIVTDRGMSVAKILRGDPRFNMIRHHFDVWHLARNLRMKLAAVKSLKTYMKATINHCWWAAKNCESLTVRYIRILCIIYYLLFQFLIFQHQSSCYL
jgi:hypothetical protein